MRVEEGYLCELASKNKAGDEKMSFEIATCSNNSSSKRTAAIVRKRFGLSSTSIQLTFYRNP